MGVKKQKITEIYVEILNWQKFNPRKDVKQSSWFRFEHSVFEDPQFFDFSHSDMVTWLYLLCQASRKSSPAVTVYVSHAERIGRLSLEQVLDALHKLNDIKVIKFNYVTLPIRSRAVTDTLPEVTRAVTCTTRRDETRRDETGRDDTAVTVVTETPEKVPSEESVEKILPPLAALWNELADPKLSKVKSMSPAGKRFKACQARWKEKPDRTYWAQVIARINSSEFCKGSKGWKMDLEFLCRPDSADLILEGKYDDRKGHGNGIYPITKTQAINQQNDEVFAREFAKLGGPGDGQLGN